MLPCGTLKQHNASHETGKELIKLTKTLSLILVLALCGCSSKNKDQYAGLNAADIYALGQLHEKKENFHLAIKDYEALEARFPYGEYADKAQLGLAYSYYKKGDASLALAEIERFIRMYPRHTRVDYAYYLKGLINFDQNMSFLFRHTPVDRSLRDPSQAQDGFKDFKEFLERFPNSEYADDARTRAQSLRNQLANYELHIADYYMKRGAFIAAANRANAILKQFATTPAVPKALNILVQAYTKMGMKNLADKALTMLEVNFPHSNEYKEALAF